MKLAPGSRLGPYEIVALIGEGGMGEVWTARDTRLNRMVAVKRAQPRHIARFKDEARAIAALNHPHICTLYDVGPDYLVMEYVEGYPLHGPIAADRVMTLAIQIASALEAAHDKGILHRDLKPSNVMVNDTTAKLLDFGIAKVIKADRPDVTRTRTGAVLGTVGYMSPEQAQGQPVDQRSDIFSFGALLYEMITGRRAFSGHSPADVLAAILRDEPVPFPMPALLARVVKRCLRKDPADRFQRMADVRAALTESGLPDPQPQISIAVLPFTDMTPERDCEYFGDGLAEEIINALTRVEGLKVIARTSAFAFKHRPTDIRRIAGLLGVGTVLEGSVRKSGSRIRVTAQLIRAADGTPSWSDRYDCELVDLFGVQDEIAGAITSALKTTLTGPPPARYTPSAAAYEAYLKGRYYQFSFTAEHQSRCRGYFKQALAADPKYALAHHGLALHYLTLAVFHLMPAHDAMPLSRAGDELALSFDPDLPESHGGLGMVAGLYDYDWKQAGRRFELAMRRRPVSSLVRSSYAFFYLWYTNQQAAAIEQLTRAVSDDPLSPTASYRLAVVLLAAGRDAEALEHLHQILEFDDKVRIAVTILALHHQACGDLATALGYAERAYTLEPRNAVVVATFAALLARAGDQQRSDALRQPLLGLTGTYGVPLALMVFHLLCHELDQAAEWANGAIDQRTPGVLQFVHMPMAAELRASAHWPALAARMRLQDAR